MQRRRETNNSSDRSAAKRLPLLTLGAFAIGTDAFVIAGLLPELAHDLHVSTASAGQLVTVFAIVYAVGSPTLSILTGTLGRRRLLTGVLVCFALANLAAAAAPSYTLLLLARIVAAGCAGLFTPTALAVAAGAVAPEKRGRALATVIAGLTIAAVLGAPLGTLIAVHANWRVTFLFVAALGALAALGVAGLLPEVAAPPPAGLRARLAIARRPAILATLTIIVACFTAAYAVYTYIAPIADAVAGVHGSGLSTILLLFGLFALGGNLFGGYGADHWTPRRTALAAVSSLTVGLLMLAALTLAHPPRTPALVGLAAVVAFWGLGIWAINAPLQKILVSHATDAPPLVLSLTGSANYLGIMLGGALGGFAFKLGGASADALLASAFALTALGALAAADGLITARNQPRRRTEWAHGPLHRHPPAPPARRGLEG
jgi:DHA1 family inner membrane transport protein